MLVYKRDNYGWEVRPGEFDGMVGELQRYEHDMLATAVFMRADRMQFIEAAGETLLARCATSFYFFPFFFFSLLLFFFFYFLFV